MPANMIDANARRARVLELLRQAVSLQVQFWEVQTRLERAMLDGKEMSDEASDEVFQYIKDLAAAASEVPNRIYEQIEDEHVTGVFRAVDAHEQAEDQIANAALFERYVTYKLQCEKDKTAYIGFAAWKETMSEVKPKTATQRYNETTFGAFGKRLFKDDLHAGLLVRYGNGSTALVRLASSHASGWHGDQCMGGSTFVCDSLYEATPLDREIWKECAKWRKS
jgi:hypothetical protein